LIGKGKVQRGMLGIGIQPVTSEIASGLGLKDVRGVLVNQVNPAGPADKAGVKTGDVILQVNGKDVNDPNGLRNEIAGFAPGTSLTLSLLRDGNPLQVRVKLGELTPDTARANQENGGSEEGSAKLGISVSPLTPERAAQLGLRRGTRGVVINEVEPDGPAAKAGIQAGDLIQEVNRQPVETPDDVRNALTKSGGRTPVLLINRGGQGIFVPVPSQ
jgi:serine protease Do